MSLGNIATYLSVVVWSAVWAFAMQCEHVPLLLMAGSIAVVWGAIAATEELIKGRGIGSFKMSGSACLFAAFGGNGFRLTVFPAVLMVDPIEAANLSNIWIGCAVIFGLLVLGEKLTARHAVGAVAFAAGVVVMVSDGFAAGHGLALFGGLIWGWYLAKSLVRSDAGRAADAAGNLVAGAGLIYLSWLVESPWEMRSSDIYWLCGLIFTENIGYVLWVYGGKHGTLRKAKISVLFLPVMAVLWICVLGDVRLEMTHIVATAAVSLVGFILSPYVFRSAITARLQGAERGPS